MKLISAQGHEQRNVPRGELDFRQGVEVETGIPEHTKFEKGGKTFVVALAFLGWKYRF